MSSPELQRGLRYAAVGSLNTLFGFGAIVAFHAAGVSALLANLGGYLIGLGLGFFLNARFAFRTTTPLKGLIFPYACLVVLAYVANLTALYVAIAWLSLPILLGQAIALASYSCLVYLGSRRLFLSTQSSP